jgi:hypothetical protein
MIVMKLFCTVVIALAAGTIVSCSGETQKEVPETPVAALDLVTVSFDTLGYEAQLQSAMKPAQGLNNDAFMQYVDSSANEFLIGIAEPKKETQYILEAAEIWDSRISFMENYQSLTQSQFQETMTIVGIPEWEKETVNGLPVETARFRAKHKDVPEEMVYTAIYFEDRTNIYILYYWSMASREAACRAHVSDFIASLKKTGAAS